MKGERHSVWCVEYGDLAPEHSRAVVVFLVDEPSYSTLEYQALHPLPAYRVRVGRPPGAEPGCEALERRGLTPGRNNGPPYGLEELLLAGHQRILLFDVRRRVVE